MPVAGLPQRVDRRHMDRSRPPPPRAAQHRTSATSENRGTTTESARDPLAGGSGAPQDEQADHPPSHSDPAAR